MPSMWWSFSPYFNINLCSRFFLDFLPIRLSLSIAREIRASRVVVHFYIYTTRNMHGTKLEAGRALKAKSCTACAALCYAEARGPAVRAHEARCTMPLLVYLHAGTQRPHPNMITVLFMIITVELCLNSPVWEVGTWLIETCEGLTSNHYWREALRIEPFRMRRRVGQLN